MSLSTENDSWDSQIDFTFPNSDTVSFRTRVIQRGIFDEVEMQLVWQRVNKSSLVYLVGSGHAGYEKVMFQVRDDGDAIWIVAWDQDAQRWQAIASLDLMSGEFHAEGDFIFSPPATAWAMVYEQDRVLVEQQLTWAQDDKSGVQRLFDGERGLLWELSEKEWVLKSGSLEETDFPRPALPYRMQAPDWAKALPQNGISD